MNNVERNRIMRIIPGMARASGSSHPDQYNHRSFASEGLSLKRLNIASTSEAQATAPSQNCIKTDGRGGWRAGPLSMASFKHFP
jgi:hypothetical protein